MVDWEYYHSNEVVEPRLLPTIESNINPFRYHALMIWSFSGELSMVSPITSVHPHSEKVSVFSLLESIFDPRT